RGRWGGGGGWVSSRGGSVRGTAWSSTIRGRSRHASWRETPARGVGHTALERVAPVAVEDDAEMPRDVSSADLPQEETSVEIVEEAAHRQSFKRAPPSRVSQKTMTAQFRFYGTA